MRVTKQDLQVKIGHLNKLTEKDWTLSQAYGGYAVTRVVNVGGGESHLFRCLGHMPARELAMRLDAYIDGHEDGYEQGYEQGFDVGYEQHKADNANI
jgi:hypothetical protein